MAQHKLAYKTFESLLADVMGDFKNYTLENLIEPQELIRVARWVTKDLGLKVYPNPKETILHIENYKAKLPDNFHMFNFGVLCGEGSVTTLLPQGVRTMEVPYPRFQSAPVTPDSCTTGTICPTDEVTDCNSCGKCTKCTESIVVVPGYNPLVPYGDPCVKPRVFMDCKGDSFELIQILSTETRTYKTLLPVRLINKTNEINDCCPNLYTQCPDEIWIENGFVHSNIKCSKLYINYDTMMEDEAGNILVPDEEILSLYYERKLKHAILEGLWMNGEDVERKLSYMKLEVRTARIEAKSLVNMIEFSELENVWRQNRIAFNDRYVNMFRARNWIY